MKTWYAITILNKSSLDCQELVSSDDRQDAIENAERLQRIFYGTEFEAILEEWEEVYSDKNGDDLGENYIIQNRARLII